jgi:hypothetical protein
MWGQPPRLSPRAKLEPSSTTTAELEHQTMLPRQAHRRIRKPLTRLPEQNTKVRKTPRTNPILTSASVHIQNDLYKMFPQEQLLRFTNRLYRLAIAVGSSSSCPSSSCMNPNASCGAGFCHTGANDWRCSGVGPCSRRAARCRGVL